VHANKRITVQNMGRDYKRQGENTAEILLQGQQGPFQEMYVVRVTENSNLGCRLSRHARLMSGELRRELRRERRLRRRVHGRTRVLVLNRRHLRLVVTSKEVGLAGGREEDTLVAASERDNCEDQEDQHPLFRSSQCQTELYCESVRTPHRINHESQLKACMALYWWQTDTTSEL